MLKVSICTNLNLQNRKRAMQHLTICLVKFTYLCYFTHNFRHYVKNWVFPDMSYIPKFSSTLALQSPQFSKKNFGAVFEKIAYMCTANWPFFAILPHFSPFSGHISKNRVFPDMGYIPKFSSTLGLQSPKFSKKSLEPFSRKSPICAQPIGHYLVFWL